MVPEVFVELVDELKGKVSIKMICEAFNVAKSTYYRWKNKGISAGLTEKEELIKSLCEKHNFTFGYRKITALIRRSQVINKNTVQKIMRKYGWSCRVKVKKKQNKKIGSSHLVYDNILNRNFHSESPMRKLVTDITYLPFGSKMLYLSSIMDLYNGEIIAYTIGDKQDVNLVLDTLNQVPNLKHCVLHSDQGAVYTSHAYQETVTKKGIIMSMSRKGTPADNACIESFHSTLKSETFYLSRINNEPTSIIKQIVNNYIKYYNESRIQQKLDYKSPVEFRLSTV